MHPEDRRHRDSGARQIFGGLLLIAATVIIVIGYRSVPDANTCYQMHTLSGPGCTRASATFNLPP